MRRLKYKLWDERNNVMLYDNFVIHACGLVFVGAEDNSRDFVTPLQYLDEEDKLGKRYCEGDVVITSYGNLVVRFGKTKGVLGFALFDSLTATSGCALVNDEYKIAGNIYENPELKP